MTAPEPKNCDGCGHWRGGHDGYGCRTISCRCTSAHGLIAPTAPKPTTEHIDAVARDIADSEGFVWPDSEHARDVWRAKAHAALAASLPTEVKAASMTDAEMLAALVDRGTLTWQHDTREWRPAAGLIPRGRNNGVRWAARRVVGEWESDYGEVAP